LPHQALCESKIGGVQLKTHKNDKEKLTYLAECAVKKCNSFKPEKVKVEFDEKGNLSKSF